MNAQLRDILKYFFLTFLSLEIIYTIAKLKPSLVLVPIVTVGLTVLYTISKLRLWEKLSGLQQSFGDRAVNKDKAL